MFRLTNRNYTQSRDSSYGVLFTRSSFRDELCELMFVFKKFVYVVTSLDFDAVSKREAVLGDRGDSVQVHQCRHDDEHVEDLVALKLKYVNKTMSAILKREY